MDLQHNIYKTLKQLVAIPSVSGTQGENKVSKKIYDILSKMPYFKVNKNNFGSEEVPKDSLCREFVWAILEGEKSSKDTVILTAHFDVVDVEEFGHLKEVAYDMEECTKRISELKLDKDALKDLKSGDWIFGRGTADIKSGIATYLEIIREISEKRNFKGNILLLLVPGEESNSEGMIASIPFLLKLQDKKGFNYVGAIVSECSIPENENDNFKRMYMGSVGKIMPMFFCIGKETHVREPFKGFNPNTLVSEINRLLEGNPDFCDTVNGRTSPPPMALKQMDLKMLYSVQSPLFAISYYNILTLNRSEEVLSEELKELSYNAFENVISDLKEKRDRFMKMSCEDIQFVDVEPCVMTYGELLLQVKEKNPDFVNLLKEKIEVWKELKVDNQNIAINIVRETYEKYEKKRPMIVISYIPPYYPHIHLNIRNDKDKKFMEVIDETIKYAEEEFNEKIIKDDFFMGISDLSYTGMEVNQNFNSFTSNIVGYGITYDLNLQALSRLNIPGVVFGGEGKDIHKNTERLNIPYSLKVVPQLYKYMIHSMLK